MQKNFVSLHGAKPLRGLRQYSLLWQRNSLHSSAKGDGKTRPSNGERVDTELWVCLCAKDESQVRQMTETNGRSAAATVRGVALRLDAIRFIGTLLSQRTVMSAHHLRFAEQANFNESHL